MASPKLASGIVLAGLLLSGCNSVTPSEKVLQECLQRAEVDISDLDVMLDGRGKVNVVSGVPDADPDSGVVEDCIAEANASID